MYVVVVIVNAAHGDGECDLDLGKAAIELVGIKLQRAPRTPRLRLAVVVGGSAEKGSVGRVEAVGISTRDIEGSEGNE